LILRDCGKSDLESPYSFAVTRPFELAAIGGERGGKHVLYIAHRDLNEWVSCMLPWRPSWTRLRLESGASVVIEPEAEFDHPPTSADLEALCQMLKWPTNYVDWIILRNDDPTF
jgi:hypothetical protein